MLKNIVILLLEEQVEDINHLLEEVDINLLLKEQVEEATVGCW